MIKQFKLEIGNRTIELETGKLAKQAGGSVTVICGGTVVLVTAVMAKEAKDEGDFFPLFVEYRERTYAAGKIPGGFLKREGRPSEKEILSARLIDRPLRPLFSESMLNEVQIMATILSSDGENDPDVLAALGASAAIAISDVPFSGPMGILRVGELESGELVINPTYAQLTKSSIDIVIAGTKDGILMLESGSKEVSEDRMLNAVKFGYENLARFIEIQEKMVLECGIEKSTPTIKKITPEVLKKIKALSLDKLTHINSLKSKEERIEQMNILSNELVEKLVTEDSGIGELDIKIGLQEVEKELVRSIVLNQNKRVDARAFDEIRAIACEVGVLPRTHGSALFTRGQTQSLSVTTLGTSSDEQLVEALEGEQQKTFMLHYNFPPFSVGEVKPLRGPGRREIGHGALAERALSAVMPSKEEFPYTIRVVSDILESNGSSSMATVCAGSLTLMDCGVPIKAAVAGISIGIVREGSKYKLLTDIAGVEDHYGDMDFKVAGTEKGITAIQLDVKLKEGITLDIIKETLQKAKVARIDILGKMNAVISKPRENISEYAPHITTFKIDPEKIRDVIGTGGKIIRKIISDTGATIEIEDDGTVSVASADASASAKAIDIIKKLTETAEVGKIYMAKVRKLMAFGAFCEILPGKDGLVHISELAKGYVKNVEDVVKVGDEFKVKVISIDEQGKVSLSRKQVEE